jgi:hypothetical protein
MTSASSAGRRARPPAAEAAAGRSPEPHDGTGQDRRRAKPTSPAASSPAGAPDGPSQAPAPPTQPEDAPDPDVAALPLDTLLSDVGKGPLGRWLPGRSGARFAASLADKPDAVRYRLAGLVGQLGRIAVGTSDLEASSKDRRFADPAWTGNPALHRVLQAYLAASAGLRCRRDHRSPLPLAELLPDHPAAGRRDAVRAVNQRAHRRDRQPAGKRQGEVPGRRPQPR